jgi:hypothetical protein
MAGSLMMYEEMDTKIVEYELAGTRIEFRDVRRRFVAAQVHYTLDLIAGRLIHNLLPMDKC